MKLSTRWELVKFRFNGAKKLTLLFWTMTLTSMVLAATANTELSRTLFIVAVFIAFIGSLLVVNKFNKLHKEEITKIIKGA